MGVCYRGLSEGVSIDVLESTLVVPVIEGVRDPPFGIAFPTDLVIVANETRRERSATCATDAAPGSDGTRASGLRVLACRAETFSQGSWSATWGWIDGRRQRGGSASALGVGCGGGWEVAWDARSFHTQAAQNLVGTRTVESD